MARNRYTVTLSAISMQTGSIHQYQQQPRMPTGHTSMEVTTATPATNGQHSNEYQPSDKAIFINAIAAEFDIRSLSPEQIPELNQKLSETGLLGGREHSRITMLASHAFEQGESSANLITALDRQRSLSSGPAPYQDKQSLIKVGTLVHNLASARDALMTR